jgi:hypothetical protein
MYVYGFDEMPGKICFLNQSLHFPHTGWDD